MNDWASGYVADIGYIYGYYHELNPLRIKLPFLASRQYFPEVQTACELGFGQGMSVGIHAAASNTSWFGTDFNPSHAAFAQELVCASGANATLSDEAFAAFCARHDLPDFDFIGLHGIWSWVNDENRHIIVDFLRRKLKVGGVLFISYNTMPGMATMLPVRELLTCYAETMCTKGQGIASRIQDALDFTHRFLATNPAYALLNPRLAERIEKISDKSPEYLAHEFFNRDWLSMSFVEMAQWLSPAKLSFACSAHYNDYMDPINLTEEQFKFLNDIPDTVFRQFVRDFMCSTQFRRDYWVKGPRRMSELEYAEMLRAQRVALVTPGDSVELKAKGPRGEAKLKKSIYEPILEVLADHKPLRLGQIESALQDKKISLSHILQAVMFLVGKNDLAIVQEEADISKAKPVADRLNRYIMDKSRSSNVLTYLASPATSGGVKLRRFQQLFLLAQSQGLKTPQEWAAFVWKTLVAQDEGLMKEGKPIHSAEESLAELTEQAQAFAEKQMPIFEALQIPV